LAFIFHSLENLRLSACSRTAGYGIPFSTGDASKAESGEQIFGHPLGD
jgi:hypothetical protein